MQKCGSAQSPDMGCRQLREQVAPCQRESRVRRARAARATHPKIRPTTTRPAPSRTSASGSFQSPAIIGALGSDARCGAPDPSYRHAMPVLGPIESCRRARSSGVGCAKIAHMNRTVAASNSVNVSTARMIGPRHTASQWLHRYPPALETNTLVAPGPRACPVAPAVAVVAHRQRPPKSHATTSGPIGITKPDVAPVTPSTRYPAAAPSSGLNMKASCTMSMTPNTASRVPVGVRVTSCGLAGGEARCAVTDYRGVAMASPSPGIARTEKTARVIDLTLRGAPA
jgi:hypothetical protein